MSIASRNVAGGFFESYAADAAVSLMFGVGYYLLQKFKSDKKENLKISRENVEPNLDFLKQDLICKWYSATTVFELNELIDSDYDGIEDPFLIISLMNRRGIFPNIETYNKLLLRCLLNKNLEAEKSIKTEIFDYLGPVQPDVSTLNVLIIGLGIKYKNILNRDQVLFREEEKFEIFKKFDEGLIELIESMENRYIFIDVSCQNSILEALVDMKRLNDVWNQYINMKKLFNGNYSTFDIIIKGFRKLCPINQLNDKDFNKIIEILRDAKSIYEIDQDGFDWVIEFCLALNKIDVAEQFLCERKEQNLNILEKTYLNLIVVYGEMLDLDKAFESFERFKDNLYKNGRNLPSTQLYYALINACVNSGNILLAESLIEEMTLSKVEKCLPIYITMINGYKNANHFNRAIELYDYLIANTSKELISDVDCFNSLLECCIETKNYEKMDIIYEYVYKATYLQLNLNTYLVLLKGYTLRNLVENVNEIYTFLNIDKDLILPEDLYNMIIQCFSRNSNGRYLIRLLNDIKENQIKLYLESYDAIIKYYCNKEDCNKAFELFDECIKRSYKPSNTVYNMVILLQIKSKLIDRAITLFRNMIINNMKADHLVYNSLIEKCFEYYRHKEAAEFIIQAVKDGINLHCNLYNKLSDCLNDDNEEFKISEKYQVITALIPVLKESKINSDKTIMKNLYEFIEDYRGNCLSKKTTARKYDSLAGKFAGYEYRKADDVEISLYEYVQSKSYVPSNRKDIIYSSDYGCWENNRQRRLGRYYSGNKLNTADYEEEKSIYS